MLKYNNVTDYAWPVHPVEIVIEAAMQRVEELI
jgi:hypothetical protein